jgi:DNA (cytosine-5)-methyltransferase 1
MKTRSLTAVELFAGAGGMALGTASAGFRHLALLERDRHAVATLRENATRGVGARTELPIEETDVRAFDYGRLQRQPVDLLAGGAPCQPFSLGGKHAGQADNRNLFPEVFRAQRALMPRAVLLENVRGLTRSSFRPYLDYILLQLALPGLAPRAGEGWKRHKARLLDSWLANDHGDAPAYDVTIGLRECANFGLPQRRGRVFMVAMRTDQGGAVKVPEGCHSEGRLAYDQDISGEYWARHGLRKAQWEASPPSAPPAPGNEAWRTVRDALREVPLPIMGEANGYHPNHIGIPGARSYPGHTGSPWDQPAKTLKAGVHGVPGGENMLRDDDGEVRYFTVHEAALLQGFPSDYRFVGSRSEAMRQIGNAAPTPVCKVIAAAIRETLLSQDSGQTNGRRPTIPLPEGPQLSLV